MPNFKCGDGEYYTGEDILSSLDFCINRESQKGASIKFASGIKLENSEFKTPPDIQIITHRDLQRFKEKLDYYVVQYDHDTLIPIKDIEQSFTLSSKEEKSFVVNENIERHCFNGFLLTSSSSLKVYEQDDIDKKNPILLNKAEYSYESDYNFYFCDLVPGKNYTLKNVENFTLTGKYISMKGAEW